METLPRHDPRLPLRSTCTKVMTMPETLQALQKAQIEASYVIIENLQKQVHLQQKMINLQWEVVEEIADAEADSQ